jgi:hypothetical protein
MREDSIFRIASQSKAIVSVAAMTLVEEGRLLLTDPVGKYLPEFRETTVAVAREGGGYDVVRAARPITVRDLLTHTSGYGYGNGIGEDRWAAAGQQGYYFADKNEIRDSVRRSSAVARNPRALDLRLQHDILGHWSRWWQTARSGAASASSSRSACDTEFYLSSSATSSLPYSRQDDEPRRADARHRGSGGAYVEGPRALWRRRPAVHRRLRVSRCCATAARSTAGAS